MRGAATRLRGDAGRAAAAGFVALPLSWLSREALASRLIKDRSTASNQPASKRAAQFLALPRNKKQRQADCNHIFANGDQEVLNVQIETSPDAVTQKSADDAAYSTKQHSREQ